MTFTKTTYGVTTNADGESCRNGMEMLAAAGGDFQVEKGQIFTEQEVTTINQGVDTDGNIVDIEKTETKHVPVSGCFLPVRSDTKATVGKAIISDRFTILNNADMINIVDEVCGQLDVDYRFISVLDNGGGLVVQATCPELNKSLGFGKDDGSDGLLTLVNYHNGKGKFALFPSLQRAICSNVVPSLKKEHREKMKANDLHSYAIRHTSKMEENIKTLIVRMREAMDDLTYTGEVFRLLANKTCSKAEEQELFNRLLNPEGKDEKELSNRAIKMRDNKLADLRRARKDPVNQIEGHGGSWAEVYQAISYQTTHASRVKDTGRITPAESRWFAGNLGSGAQTAKAGLELAMEMAGV